MRVRWEDAERKPRVAVVTGASAGIGAAIAESLGELGWSVAVGARRVDRVQEVAKRVETAGGRGFAHALDVSEPESVDAFFDAAESALGPVGALVNNAAVGTPGMLHEMSPESIRREITTGLIGSLYAARRAIASMIESGTPGDLLFVSSDSAVRQWPRHVPYAASKAGIEHAAQALRLELEGTGIRSQFLRVGNTIGTEFSAGWDFEKAGPTFAYWRSLGLIRHEALLEPHQVAQAVLLALTAPRALHLDTLSINPQAPQERGRS